MVQINFAQKQVNAKIVYYGPGMSGKTTNLEIIHQRAPENNRGDLTSISTEGDRTLFFDFMPLDLGTVSGMRTCFQIYTVPGQVYYNSTRKLVLQGVDGVIFVADSSPNMMEENLESLRNLAENLAEYGRSIADMPLVIQYNKRDIPGALSIEELEEQLNPTGVPAFEAIANTGKGVFPTLKAVAASVLDSLHKQQSDASGTSAGAPQAPGAEAAPAAMPEAPGVEAPGVPPPPAPSATPSAAPLSVPPAPTAAQGDLPPVAASPPARPTAPMSQTGFHKAPSVPLAASASTPPAAPTPPEPVEAQAPAPAPAPELRMAPRPSSLPDAEASPPEPAPSNLQMQAQPAPVAAAPQPVAPQPAAPQSAAPQSAAPQPAQAATSPSSVMGVEQGTRAPQRRAPASRSFPTKPAMPEPRATPKADRGALVTGLIIVVSVGVGAALGGFVLSLL